MLFTVNHSTRLEYSKPISESVMEVRAKPRTDERQVLRQFELTVSPSARTNHHLDWLENTVHQFSVLGIHDFVEVHSRCVVETRPTTWDLDQLVAPIDGLIRDHRSWDFLQHHGPVVNDPAIPALANRLGLTQARRVGQALDVVLRRTRDVISYRRGATTSASTVGDVLSAGAGVCQDFAHLGLALLRHAGIPCRYVSGYLFRDQHEELETHAWLEAFVPGFGWIGIDPTHGTQVTEDHLTVAVGRSYADVPPNRGVYRGDAGEQIRVKVFIERIAEQARLTPYSTAIALPRKRLVSAVSPPTRAFHLGLEQQRLQPNAAGLVNQQQRQQQQ